MNRISRKKPSHKQVTLIDKKKEDHGNVFFFMQFLLVFSIINYDFNFFHKIPSIKEWKKDSRMRFEAMFGFLFTIIIGSAFQRQREKKNMHAGVQSRIKNSNKNTIPAKYIENSSNYVTKSDKIILFFFFFYFKTTKSC